MLNIFFHLKVVLQYMSISGHNSKKQKTKDIYQCKTKRDKRKCCVGLEMLKNITRRSQSTTRLS